MLDFVFTLCLVASQNPRLVHDDGPGGLAVVKFSKVRELGDDYSGHARCQSLLDCTVWRVLCVENTVRLSTRSLG
ncbi:hypothetical protein RMSM_06192 [Rhodopirellula maiorica SM1]|uniref:Uncharacterized protein n=1 Tax=Rhodopirellula maiorica SM1 TaxID=1265738 RepID=M5RNC2_9BACT|nr:hypothetical protein RMSM_06192 [Rhodopirellula maiorica SM1]